MGGRAEGGQRPATRPDAGDDLYLDPPARQRREVDTRPDHQLESNTEQLMATSYYGSTPGGPGKEVLVGPLDSPTAVLHKLGRATALLVEQGVGKPKDRFEAKI